MPADPLIIQRFKQIYEDKYHVLIESALNFLADHEASWNLDQPINKDKYIADLVADAS